MIIPHLFNALILGFPCPSSEKDQTLSILQRSLSQTVAERPYLAAEMVCENSDNPPDNMRPGDLWLEECQGTPDIEIVVNDMTGPDHEWSHSYEELREAGMPLSALNAKLLAPLSGYKTSNKVMAAQANFIDGGCLLSVYFLHTFVDGWGACMVMGAWAHNSRSLQAPSLGSLGSLGSHPLARLTAPATRTPQVPDVLSTSTATSSISRRAEYERLKKRPELWQLLGLDWRPAPKAPSVQEFAPSTMTMNTSIFTATAETLAKLKTDTLPASPGGHDNALPWISTKDALAALLWRSIMKARFPSPLTVEDGKPVNSIVAVAIDARSALGIPTDYIGNVIFESMTELSIESLKDPQVHLASIATRLRASLQAAKEPARLRDAVALASSIPDARRLAFAFSDWVGADLIVTSWIDMPFYEQEWGPIFGKTGKAEFFRMPKGQFEGICSVQPRHPDGSVDIVIGLNAEQMKRLRADATFGKYLAFKSH